MANIGLIKPLIAKLVDEATKAYTGGFYCGHAIQVDVTPNYSEGNLYGDDMLVEYDKEFKDGDVSLNTTHLPIASASTMFGHTVSGQQVVYKSSDEANYVGVGFLTKKKVDGVTSYVGNVIYKAKFTEGQETHNTKGDNIEYGTPTISGKIAPLSTTSEWKATKEFDNQGDAIAWYEGILNYSATSTYSVIFNSMGGSAVETQRVAAGEKVIEPDDPTKEGSTFAGWYSDLDCTDAWTFATDTVTSDLMLYAKWTS
ncbi:MAG: InlB B-repeat-containing protein [Lachnospiraceae bacterium]|nr:InlB B-repeat-containing protein [Lachnospiraceae bacterium]